MKTKFIALALATVTALSLTPKPAAANDKGLAIVGGFLGGLIVASAINDSRHDRRYEENYGTVVVVNDRDDRCEKRRDGGYWNVVSVQIWVPGYWITERSHRSCYRRYVGGHYENRNDRVWVAYDRYDRRNHHDRESGRGYGRNR